MGRSSKIKCTWGGGEGFSNQKSDFIHPREGMKMGDRVGLSLVANTPNNVFKFKSVC